MLQSNVTVQFKYLHTSPFFIIAHISIETTRTSLGLTSAYLNKDLGSDKLLSGVFCSFYALTYYGLLPLNCLQID